MPEVSLDFGNVGKLPPPGTYRVRIEKGVYGPNKDKDGFMITLHNVCIEDDPTGEFEGYKIFPNPIISMKQSALEFTQNCLEAITQEEWRDDNMRIVVDDDYEVPMLADRTALVKCKHGVYNNNPQFQIAAKGWLPDNGEFEVEVELVEMNE